MSEEEKKFTTSVFAVRTTAGQEKNVADLISARVATTDLPIKAILVPEALKGYVLIEAEGPHFVEKAIAGIKHVRSRIQGIVSFKEVEQYVVMKPVIDELDELSFLSFISQNTFSCTIPLGIFNPIFNNS